MHGETNLTRELHNELRVAFTVLKEEGEAVYTAMLSPTGKRLNEIFKWTKNLPFFPFLTSHSTLYDLNI